MPLFQDTAIVLRRLDYSETSQVLAVFTRLHGQQRLIAKGIKRSTKTRVAVGVDLLEYGDLSFSMRPDKPDTMATLTEWRQRDHFPGIRRELVRSHAAQYAAEVTSRLTESHDPHSGLFDALLALLSELGRSNSLSPWERARVRDSNSSTAPQGGKVAPAGDEVRETAAAASELHSPTQDVSPTQALVDYLWTMLTELGLRPEMEVCVGCRRPIADDPMLYFSSREGGVVCRDCEPAFVEKRRIPPGVARTIGSLGDRQPHSTGDRTALAAFDLLDYHFTETLAGPPKLSGPLRGLLGLAVRTKR